MTATNQSRSSRWLPKSMAARLYLVLFSGLLIAHGMSFGLLFYERYEAATSMLMANLEQDVVVAVKLLDRLPPQEREQWLPVLRRRTFHYMLGSGQQGGPLRSDTARSMARSISAALGSGYQTGANSISDRPERFQVHLHLSDGTPLTIEVQPSVMPLAKWLPYVLIAQLGLLLACAWTAVRLATRPLERLARAAEQLSPAGDGERLPENGPREVSQAAAAFNSMQTRIAQYTGERMRILAAISHDLQTPITRMALRLDAMEESSQRDKLVGDLKEMHQLVREGIAYARSSHGASESAVRVDLNAFLDTLVYDYQDGGQQVTLSGLVADGALITRPRALRRILSNLIDNALKYAGAAEVDVASEAGAVLIYVRDRGPGIPESELGNVMEPFYRLEASRNRDTGGTGLGLAIAHQLADSVGGKVTLSNRPSGGLEALVRLDRNAVRLSS